jgi:hypothetical protein
MNERWGKRIQRLESILQKPGRPPVIFRYGYVRSLPQDPSSERHIAIAKSEPTILPNVERCEFEERVGSEGHADFDFTVYLSVEDQARSRTQDRSSKEET